MLYNHKNGITFRKVEEADIYRLRELKNDSWTTTHNVSMVNEQDQMEWLKSMPKNDLHLIGYTLDWRNERSETEKDGPSNKDENVGILSITNIDWNARTANIGGSIFHNYRGTEWSEKGWAAGTDFAFEMLNLHRLTGEVLEYNIAALKMDLKLGYKIEGRKRESVYKCGAYYDSLILGLLREEWQKSPRVKEMGICNNDFNHATAYKLIERFEKEGTNGKENFC